MKTVSPSGATARAVADPAMSADHAIAPVAASRATTSGASPVANTSVPSGLVATSVRPAGPFDQSFCPGVAAVATWAEAIARTRIRAGYPAGGSVVHPFGLLSVGRWVGSRGTSWPAVPPSLAGPLSPVEGRRAIVRCTVRPLPLVDWPPLDSAAPAEEGT